jgi:hypothetical protein
VLDGICSPALKRSVNMTSNALGSFYSPRNMLFSANIVAHENAIVKKYSPAIAGILSLSMRNEVDAWKCVLIVQFKSINFCFKTAVFIDVKNIVFQLA